MSYLFVVPPQYQAMLKSGELIRRGALLIHSKGGGIAAHLQETGAFAKTGAQVLGNLSSPTPIGMATKFADIAVKGVTVWQNEQIKGGIRDIKATLDVLGGVATANLVTSLVGVGITVASTAIMVQRIDRLRSDIEGLASSVAAFRTEWNTAELDRRLQSARTELSRVDSAHRRQDAKSVLDPAERELHHVFDDMAARAGTLFKRSEIPADALRIILDGLTLAGGARLKALFLLDEADMADDVARQQIRTLTDLTMSMPADRLALRLVGPDSPADVAKAASARLAMMREAAASIPPLVETLRMQGLRPSAYLSAATKETSEPLMLLPRAT